MFQVVEVGKGGPKDGYKTMRIQYILTNLGIEMVICARKRKCCVFSITSKGKAKAPVVRTGILWHKTKRIQDMLTNLEFYLITYSN